jgi:hypothetical protein
MRIIVQASDNTKRDREISLVGAGAECDCGGEADLIVQEEDDFEVSVDAWWYCNECQEKIGKNVELY